MLKACKHSTTVAAPGSKRKLSASEPAANDQPAPLLWGHNISFRRRGSRGIISVSPSLLTYWPTFLAGRDSRVVCLAYGSLARNKELRPWTLVRNLNTTDALQAFEANSIQWPRPAKTLSSIYHTKFAYNFSRLGDSYVIVATDWLTSSRTRMIL